MMTVILDYDFGCQIYSEKKKFEWSFALQRVNTVK